MTDLVVGRRSEDLEKRTRQHGQDCVVGIGLPSLLETESRPAVKQETPTFSPLERLDPRRWDEQEILAGAVLL